MEYIKQFFAKIITGFLLGTGFVFAAGLLGGYAILHMKTTAMEQTSASTSEASLEKRFPQFIEYDESAKLSANVKTEKIGDGTFALLGEIENKGEHSWQSINLQADLFNGKEEFIEQCSEYVTQIVHPGETINFKLACRSSSCNSVDVNGYKSYKLTIAGARYIRKPGPKEL